MNNSEVAKDRKHKIVQATAESIVEDGYYNFSIQKVAQRAGVTKGVIHYYYLNKNALMSAALEFIFVEISSNLKSTLEKVKDPQEKLEIFIKKFINILSTHKGFYHISTNFLLTTPKQNILKQHLQFFQDTCEEIILEGISQKRFIKVESASYAKFIVSTLSGLNFHKFCYAQEQDKAIDKLTISGIFSGLQINN
jgi:TetR/AcrR family transcriptional regulator, fatty acid metabolism regulator protein